jgi:23S rRNA (uracil1939-C5)-methyltransferase
MTSTTDTAPADIAVVTVDGLTHDGRGVARLDGKVVFVEGALPGEKVKIKFGRRRNRYDNAALLEIVEPSAQRRTPPCAHFGVCGGCSMQHVDSEVQVGYKQQSLREQLARIGKVEPEHWLDPLTGPTFHYRRRARLGARYVVKKGATFVGFREKQKSYLTNLDDCLVLDETVAKWLPDLRVLIDGLEDRERVPQIEVAVGDNARALVFRHLVPLNAHDQDKLVRFGQAHEVQIFAQSGGPETILPLWPAQPEPLFYRAVDGSQIFFRPTDFIQVNSAVNAKMVEQALALLEVQPQDYVLDLFAGLGNFTLPLARRAARVLGVEGGDALVEGARHNARVNNLTNVEFRTANLFADDASASWQDFAFTKLLLDPPRTGSIEVIKQLREPLPERIVYVSCYPATLARDAQYLVQVLGYRMSAAGAMDMFPHTSHVESMALFEKKTS